MEYEEGNGKRELSALLDGELESHEFVRLAARLGDAGIQRSWQAYVLIGDCLRGEASSRKDLVAAVMARLENEPTILAPRNLAKREQQPGRLLAMAASLAGVAVVAWLALAGGGESKTAPLVVAGFSPSAADVRPAAVSAQHPSVAVQHADAPAPREIGEYLLAHHVQAAGFRYGDGSQQVRTVSWLVGGDRP